MPPSLSTAWPDSSPDLSRISQTQKRRAIEAARQALQWTPINRHQAQSFLSEADELFTGGTAGSGKSDLLLGLALTQHRKSLILRRQATQLQELTSRIHELIRPGDHWRGSGHGGTLRTADGRMVELTGCEHETDKQKFKGRAHDGKFWDEVVDFPESVYLFVNGWNRTTDPRQRCRIVAASNPPTTSEGEWVIRRWRAWLDPTAGVRTDYGALRWYSTIDGDEQEFPDGSPITHKGLEYRPRSRSFIPGKMLKLLLDTGYRSQLATLPEPLRSIYLDGDFAASRQDHRWQLIPTAWVLQAQARYGALRAAWASKDRPPGMLDAIGADIARGGSDRTALAPRYGRVIAPLVMAKGVDTATGQHILDLLIPILRAGGPMATVNFDADGIGAAAYDLTQAQVPRWKNVVAVRSGMATDWTDPGHPQVGFANVRSAMWWNVKSLLNPEGDPATRLALPPDPELVADLTAPRYRLTVRGIQVEPKEEHADGPGIRKRLGRSTDKGDSVALSCWPGETKKTLIWGRTGPT